MRAADTNVLVRLVARDDTRQVAAADAYVADGAWVSTLALAEATWVLTSVYKLNAGRLADVIGKLLDHQSLVLQDPDVVAAALRLFKQKPSVGFSDCLLLGVAAKAGHLPLGTFDRNLAKLEGVERLLRG